MNEHARAHELLPWRVNGRIESRDAAWLDGHLENCDACRIELAAQQRLRNAIAREPTVEFAPQAGFNRLWKRIEADAHGSQAAPAPAAAGIAAAAPSAPPRSFPWMRAALALQAAAIAVLCIALWRSAPASPSYRTVTDAPASAVIAGPVVKAIFDDQVRLADLKDILAASGLVVAAGPSEAGVYTLVPRDAGVADIPAASLARLRADPRVRFAEPGAR
ncbi:MAG: zf-HC2 domain-containing protein [Steroidobacteraceae bacterium]